VLGELSNLRRRDKKLGDALGWIVDSLLQDESNVEDVERLKRKRREAVESLSYIRDVLISESMDLEPERLVGEEEMLRRRALQKTNVPAQSESQPIRAETVAHPQPAPTIDTRTRHATERAFARSPPRASPLTGQSRSSFASPGGAVPPGSLPRKAPASSTGKPARTGETAGKKGRSMGMEDPLGALGK